MVIKLLNARGPVQIPVLCEIGSLPQRHSHNGSGRNILRSLSGKFRSACARHTWPFTVPSSGRPCREPFSKHRPHLEMSHNALKVAVRCLQQQILEKLRATQVKAGLLNPGKTPAKGFARRTTGNLPGTGRVRSPRWLSLRHPPTPLRTSHCCQGRFSGSASRGCGRQWPDVVL